MRQFETGATRDSDDGKLDYEGFLSPLVLKRFAIYMHEHRIQADGLLRDSDNWQKGIPPVQYMKSMLRHVMNVWLCMRHQRHGKELEDDLCGVMFNAMGLLHEHLRGMSPDDPRPSSIIQVKDPTLATKAGVCPRDMNWDTP